MQRRVMMAAAAFPPFADGGGPISALHLAKALRAAGHELEVFNVADRDELDDISGIPVHRMRSPNVYWNYRVRNNPVKKAAWHILENFNPVAFHRMTENIKIFKPDIIITDSIENINVATWIAAKMLRVPTIHLLRSTFLLCWRGGMRRRGRNCIKPCVSCLMSSVGKRLSAKSVDAVVGETHFILNKHLQNGYFPQAKTRIIPGIADQSAEIRRPPVSKSLRLGFLGVHDENKGLTVLAAAMKIVPEELASLDLAGARSNQLWSEGHLFNGSNVSVRGWVDPAEFLSSIDVLVIPSLFEEPFGRVAIEAFSAGVPVIASRIGGIPEVVEQGVNGLLVEPGDPFELARAINKLATSPHMIGQLRAGAINSSFKYQAGQVVQSFERLFDEVLDDYV